MADHFYSQVSTQTTPWPTRGLRRVSVNSFGFGGINSHLVLDDAFSYLQSRGLPGNHCTIHSRMAHAFGIPCTPTSTNNAIPMPRFIRNCPPTGHHEEDMNPPDVASASRLISRFNGSGHINGDFRSTEPEATGRLQAENTSPVQLLVWNAADEKSLHRMMDEYEQYFHDHIAGDAEMTRYLAFTLASRRSSMLWKTFAVVDTDTKAAGSPLKLRMAAPVRSVAGDNLAFVLPDKGFNTSIWGLNFEGICHSKPLCSEPTTSTGAWVVHGLLLVSTQSTSTFTGCSANDSNDRGAPRLCEYRLSRV